jgi:hypothetical protein
LVFLSQVQSETPTPGVELTHGGRIVDVTVPSSWSARRR